jgi:hypothetical protein
VALADEFVAVLRRAAAPDGPPIRDVGAWCAANARRAREGEDMALRQAMQTAIVIVRRHERGTIGETEARAALADLVRRYGLGG